MPQQDLGRSNFLGAGRYAARLYRIGQPVRIDGIEGTVVQLTPTAVVVDTGEGRAVVPAARFAEVCSVLLPEEP